MLQLWKRASNYIGEDYFDYYVVYSRNRDSNVLEQSNFEAALKLLGGECEDKVIIIRSGHWGCGWLELLLVHKDDSHVAIAENIHEQLESYPVLNDIDYSDRVYEAVVDNIKDSLYQIADIDNIPEAKDLYSALGRMDTDLDEEFYPNRELLLSAIACYKKHQARQELLKYMTPML
jgi:hypothetical protein